MIRLASACPAVLLASGLALSQAPSRPADVPVTIKELDVQEAIAEFQDFRRRLGQYQESITQSRAVAKETAQILAELRETATPDNNQNEGPILEAITNYVDGVLGQQVTLVDFLASQRYRISYYANKMASSVRPEKLALLFGTENQNDRAIANRVRALDASRRGVADFVDSLPEGSVDKVTFRPSASMDPANRRKLDQLIFRYQQDRNSLSFAKKRLEIVRAGRRASTAPAAAASEIDPDLLVGQMFGTLDRIRLQMSLDLTYLEQLLSNHSRSAQTKEILEAFQNLVEMQGSLEGPSPELAGVLDWLQDSSIRSLSVSASQMSRPGGPGVPRYSNLLREAYEGARGTDQ